MASTTQPLNIYDSLYRDIVVDDTVYRSYLLVTPTKIYIGEHSFYEEANPGDVLLDINSQRWWVKNKYLKKDRPNLAWKEKYTPRPPLLRAILLINNVDAHFRAPS